MYIQVVYLVHSELCATFYMRPSEGNALSSKNSLSGMNGYCEINFYYAVKLIVKVKKFRRPSFCQLIPLPGLTLAMICPNELGLFQHRIRA